MGGKTEAQIIEERLSLENKIIRYLGPNVQFLNTNFNFPGKNALFYLAKSLEVLSQADIAFFAERWENYKGCKIEHQCCLDYGIKRVYELNLKFD